MQERRMISVKIYMRKIFHTRDLWLHSLDTNLLYALSQQKLRQKHAQKWRIIMKDKLFTKDFTMVVIGQIISLFGNSAVRFVLPLYLLNQTGSSALYGTVMACAFIPAVLLSPVGGLVADRVNKRNIMEIGRAHV